MKIDADEVIKKFIVEPGKKISLKRDFDPKFTLGLLKNSEAKAKLQEGIEIIAELQNKLYAQNSYALLVIFQAMDAAGKDSTIKHVMSGVNPQGCQVYSFKKPSDEELDHDYLWRCATRLPERGRIGIFNRSYYEEVLVARVHPEILERQHLPRKLKDKQIWQRRFEEINNFERYLVDNGIIVLKFFLNVSKEEQRKRFLERIEQREKNWKFSASDVAESGYWNQYMRAYEDCFNHTSSKWAPWYVIPADHKPFTRLSVGYVIYKTLKDLHLRYPTLNKEAEDALIKAKKLLTR